MRNLIVDFINTHPIVTETPTQQPSQGNDFECNQDGYLQYLAKWTPEQKCTSRDPTNPEFQKRLEYFIDACNNIHYWNMEEEYKMEFTFYADWHPDEFMEITKTKPIYRKSLPVFPIMPIHNNSNWRHLMPSVTPCDYDVDDDYSSYSLSMANCRPQNCSVSWAFAVTNSIEYAIKQLYLEEFDQTISVSLSAQELIDCVGKEHGLEYEACSGLPIEWGFDYIYDNGIAFSQYYPHTNMEDECVQVDDEKKYHIAGYDKPIVYNKRGLFELVMRGPTAVTLGLDPEYFQYYGSDNVVGPYFDSVLTTNQWQASVHGVVVEYYQYESDGSDTIPNWPFFAIETRLRPCNSNVFRIPILETTDDDNIAGIAGYAIRPIVSEILATPEPTTPNHSS